MNEQQLIKVIEEVVSLQIPTLVGTLVVIGVALYLLRYVGDSLASYFLLRIDMHVGVGRSVEVYGRKGRIKKITIFTVVVETCDGYIRIPIREWRTSRYVVLKDIVPNKRRRQNDGE